MNTNATTYYEENAGRMSRMRAAAPEIARAFGGMFANLMKEGTLGVREKELIALGIGVAVHCEPCIFAHTEKALKAGATREQVLEAAGVAVVMQGGPAYTHVPAVVEALDHLQEAHAPA